MSLGPGPNLSGGIMVGNVTVVCSPFGFCVADASSCGGGSCTPKHDCCACGTQSVFGLDGWYPACTSYQSSLYGCPKPKSDDCLPTPTPPPPAPPAPPAPPKPSDPVLTIRKQPIDDRVMFGGGLDRGMDQPGSPVVRGGGAQSGPVHPSMSIQMPKPPIGHKDPCDSKSLPPAAPAVSRDQTGPVTVSHPPAVPGPGSAGNNPVNTVGTDGHAFGFISGVRIYCAASGVTMFSICGNVTFYQPSGGVNTYATIAGSGVFCTSGAGLSTKVASATVPPGPTVQLTVT